MGANLVADSVTNWCLEQMAERRQVSGCFIRIALDSRHRVSPSRRRARRPKRNQIDTMDVDRRHYKIMVTNAAVSEQAELRMRDLSESAGRALIPMKE